MKSSKDSETNPLPRNGWTQAPNELLCYDLSAEAKVLWLILKAHCINDHQCYPSIRRLAGFLRKSPRWTTALMRQLETAGWLKVVARSGRSTVYQPICPTEQPMNSISSQPLKYTSVVEPNPCTPLQGRDEVHFTPPLKSTSPELDSTEIDVPELHISGPSGRQNSSKPAKKRNRNTRSSRESVETAIDSLDLAKFAQKYPDVTVQAEHQSFKDHFLFKNDARTGKPNWQKWSDWNRAFHTWCRNAQRFNPKPQKPTDFLNEIDESWFPKEPDK